MSTTPWSPNLLGENTNTNSAAWKAKQNKQTKKKGKEKEKEEEEKNKNKNKNEKRKSKWFVIPRYHGTPDKSRHRRRAPTPPIECYPAG